MTRARSRLAVGALGIAAAALGVAACAAIAGIDDPRSRAEDASVGSLEAAPEGSDSATNDSGVRPPAPDGALPDSGVTASSCGARAVDDVNGVFVAPGGADDLACGTRPLPCHSLQMGLMQASTLGKSIVYAASGTYVESVSLAGGLSMEGAWGIDGSTWSPRCDLDAGGASVVQAPAGQNVTITADSLNGAATLRLLTIESQPTATPGPMAQSLYGVVARGATTTLTLDEVIIDVAAGGDGVGGAPGVAASPAQGAGCPVTSTNGAQGDAGAASTGGQFGSGGFAPGAGALGGTGVPGPAGAAGSAGACRSGCGQCLDTVHCSFTSESAMVCGAQGQGGCGGPGGLGGAGGGGGGSSIALYVWDALVTCVDTVFASGNGGAGAPGGVGGDGGAPTTGAAGATATCETGCSFQCDAGCSSGPTCVLSSLPAAGGAAGVTGQAGGKGGSGGGGAGGWSCGYYAGGSGSVTVAGASAFSVGDGGAGGSAGAASGVAGTKCPP